MRVRIPPQAQQLLGRGGEPTWSLADRLDSHWTGTAARQLLETDGAAMPDLPPCSAILLEIGATTRQAAPP